MNRSSYINERSAVNNADTVNNSAVSDVRNYYSSNDSRRVWDVGDAVPYTVNRSSYINERSAVNNADTVNNSAVNDVRNYYSSNDSRAVNSSFTTDLNSNYGDTVSKNNSAVSVVNGIMQNSVPLLAGGGFLSQGSAVVGEVGPELLSIINGGALVTPLVRQTAEEKTKEEHVQKLFYNEYNVNATIASDYDITRLAEELATEQRRIEEGKGL